MCSLQLSGSRMLPGMIPSRLRLLKSVSPSRCSVRACTAPDFSSLHKERVCRAEVRQRLGQVQAVWTDVRKHEAGQPEHWRGGDDVGAQDLEGSRLAQGTHSLSAQGLLAQKDSAVLRECHKRIVTQVTARRLPAPACAGRPP